MGWENKLFKLSDNVQEQCGFKDGFFYRVVVVTKGPISRCRTRIRLPHTAHYDWVLCKLRRFIIEAVVYRLKYGITLWRKRGKMFLSDDTPIIFNQINCTVSAHFVFMNFDDKPGDMYKWIEAYIYYERLSIPNGYAVGCFISGVDFIWRFILGTWYGL